MTQHWKAETLLRWNFMIVGIAVLLFFKQCLLNAAGGCPPTVQIVDAVYYPEEVEHLNQHWRKKCGLYSNWPDPTTHYCPLYSRVLPPEYGMPPPNAGNEKNPLEQAIPVRFYASVPSNCGLEIYSAALIIRNRTVDWLHGITQGISFSGFIEHFKSNYRELVLRTY